VGINMPYETKRSFVDFKKYIDLVEDNLAGRKKNGVLKSEADYLVGAMVIFTLLEEWPPSHWVFDIMNGDSILDRKDAFPKQTPFSDR